MKLQKNPNEPTISIPLQHETLFIKQSLVIKFQAEGNYTRIYWHNGKPILSSKNLDFFYKQLNGYPFNKCHRSNIVNVHYIKAISNDHKSLRLEGDLNARIARGKYSGLSEMIGSSNSRK